MDRRRTELVMRCVLVTVLVAAALCRPAAAATPEDKRVPTSLGGLLNSLSGVVGSGDHLSLQFVIDGQRHELNVGGAYEGWTLSALSPSEATFSRPGTIARVGLNKTGELPTALPLGEMSKITVLLDGEDQTLLDKSIAAGLWDGRPFAGLSYDKTVKLVLANQRLEAATRTAPQGLSVAELKQIVGGDAAWDEMLTLVREQEQARSVEQPPSPEAWAGPSTYYVAPGESQADVASHLGVERGGVWIGTKDDVGGWVYTRPQAGEGLSGTPGGMPPPPPVPVAKAGD